MGLITVKTLDYVYDTVSLPKMQQLIRSVCKENLQFEKKEVRTVTLNRLISLSACVSGQHRRNKNGTEGGLSLLSHLVIPLGFEPRTHTLKVYCSTS